MLLIRYLLPKYSMLFYIQTMNKLLFQSKHNYLTTDYLLNLFKNYKAPRDKIKNSVKSGDLIHIKNGLYILGDVYDRQISKEVVSGLIYGPSAISFEYAMAFHNLIPEKVTQITCICFKRNKYFNTPIGRFSYKYISQSKYSPGIQYHETPLGNFFIASPEKALCDTIYFNNLITSHNIHEYITEDLRIDQEELKKLNMALLVQLVTTYKRNRVISFMQYVANIQKSAGDQHA